MTVFSSRFKFRLVALALATVLATSTGADAQSTAPGKSSSGEVRRTSAPPAVPTADGKQRFVLAELEAAIREAGVPIRRLTGGSGNPAFVLEIAGTKFRMTAYGADQDSAASLQLRAAFKLDYQRSKEEKLAAANLWNRQKRYAKVYLDDDEDFIVEMDVVPVGAIDAKSVTTLITGIWMRQVLMFANTPI